MVSPDKRRCGKLTGFRPGGGGSGHDASAFATSGDGMAQVGGGLLVDPCGERLNLFDNFTLP